MKLSDLQSRNEATLQAIRESHAQGTRVDSLTHPFYGFYEADIFECPPFLMFTNNDCPRAWDILYHRSFEPQSMKIWCRLARNATGILDVGAHVGVYSLAAATLRPDLRIHAFEPNPYAFARLRMHKLVNNLKKLEEHTVAVGEQNDFVHFGWVKKPTLQIASGGGVGKRVGDSVENTVVRMATLDGSGVAAQIGDRPLVKVDVEGGEAHALQGMQEVLALKPDLILETFNTKACDAINAQIAPLGYRVYKVFEQEGRLKQQPHLMPADMQSGDFNQLLTIRSDAEVAALAG